MLKFKDIFSDDKETELRFDDVKRTIHSEEGIYIISQNLTTFLTKSIEILQVYSEEVN